MCPITSPASVRSWFQVCATGATEGEAFCAALLSPQAMSRTHRATMPAPRSMWSQESSRQHPSKSSGLDWRPDYLDVESRRQPPSYLDRVLVGFRISQAE